MLQVVTHVVYNILCSAYQRLCKFNLNLQMIKVEHYMFLHICNRSMTTIGGTHMTTKYILYIAHLLYVSVTSFVHVVSTDQAPFLAPHSHALRS